MLVPTLGAVAELSVGYAHNRARLTNVTVRCRGGNANGPAGDGRNAARLVPTAVP